MPNLERANVDAIVKLVRRLMQRESQALSRLITLVERDGREVPEIMKRISPHLGKAYLVGITGPPGSGKSTLVDRLTGVARTKGVSVGIIAVDPTSLFTGGAVLGDRIRMEKHYLDPGVFIRSMGSRVSRRGLPDTVGAVAKLFDAFGKELILVETVGVGQTELDIINTADTVIVVFVPEAGDTIQAMKAGLMEIGNIFVINKADREGAERLKEEVEAVLRMRSQSPRWEPSVITTQAVNDIGIDELWRAVDRHQEYLHTSGELVRKRQQQRKEELLQKVEQRLCSRIGQLLQGDDRLKSVVEKAEKGEIDTYTATDIVESEIFSRVLQ